MSEPIPCGDVIAKAKQWLAASEDTRAENEAYLIQELLARVQELEALVLELGESAGRNAVERDRAEARVQELEATIESWADVDATIRRSSERARAAEARVQELERERNDIRAAFGLMAGGTGLTLAQEIQQQLAGLKRNVTELKSNIVVQRTNEDFPNTRRIE